MRTHAPVLALAVAGLVGAACFAAAADDKEKAKEKERLKARELVLKLADAIEKGNDADIKKQADELKNFKAEAYPTDLEPIMKTLQLRERDGVGFPPGGKPGNPDGIEAQLINLSKKKELTKAEMTKSGNDIIKATYIMEAISQ